ncbi:hypothetical protein O3597_04055 [Verrucosispora sp. WMMA2044]|uniref:Uncharacterized protein n=1 Tax=Verrucosispora sioxanthis TaxID=2499994 RepID=A0A6M1LBV5_9ACTN|nr:MULTISPECIES: hypothetical protein [Micromonospora]NEE66539.1 hypothetical protein [Verrucosispora sioxanthis]NGM15649.1 hypothetical protein [Verrucosispora sioxanthis]WBB49667.1 hypothetical protein O3597_04055 [Verrucosispora sp. WMMA2044]
METNAVPVDLTQTWDEARNVDGEDSSIVFTPPESDGHGGYVDNDGNPVDEFGRDIPQPDGNGGWVNHEGEPVTEEGAPLPAADGSIPAPDLGDWKVSTGDIRDAEDRILTLTKTEIDQFESFRDSVMQRASWIFYAENYADTQVSRHSGDRIQGNHYAAWSDGPDEYYASVKDPHPEQTEQIQYNQYQLLQSVGGVLELVGQYVAKLNNTAQIYAAADINSAPPTD